MHPQPEGNPLHPIQTPKACVIGNIRRDLLQGGYVKSDDGLSNNVVRSEGCTEKMTDLVGIQAGRVTYRIAPHPSLHTTRKQTAEALLLLNRIHNLF